MNPAFAGEKLLFEEVETQALTLTNEVQMILADKSIEIWFNFNFIQLILTSPSLAYKINHLSSLNAHPILMNVLATELLFIST